MAEGVASNQARNVLASVLMPARRRRANKDHASFGERLRRFRRERQLTQVQLAKKLGTDASYVARLETGKIGSPGLESLHRIAEALELPVSALTGGEAVKDADVIASITNSQLDEEAKRTLIRMYRALSKE